MSARTGRSPSRASRRAVSRRVPARTATRRRRLALVGAALVLAAAVVLVRAGGEDRRLVPGGGLTDATYDPLAYEDDRREEFEERAAAGFAHGLYRHSPGGAEATARRTARWRPLVESAAEAGGVDPDLLEALVFLESGGRPDARAPGSLEAAVGLTQILAGTARDFLGMRVDVGRAEALTERLAEAEARGQRDRARRLRAERRQADPRFDPRAALAGAGRYLRLARGRLGRADLAFVSYHMGIGNLEGVLRRFTAAPAGRPVRPLVEDRELSYAEIYFDSTPLRHDSAHERLASFGDESAAYYWKLLSAREIMRLFREDLDELRRRARLHGRAPSAELVLRAPATTPPFATPPDLVQAYEDGELVALPVRAGLRPAAGLASPERGRPPVERALRRPAAAAAAYLGAAVRAIAGPGPLEVVAAVRDAAHPVGPAPDPLHATGYAFDVRRRYRSRRHALAFQWALDRLRALDVIAYRVDRRTLHVVVGPRGEELEPLLDRREG